MLPSTNNKKNISIIGQLIKNEPDLISLLREGDLIEAKFLERTSRAAYFDLDKFGTGIIYGIELSNAKNILKNLKPGDQVTAKVISLENENGFVELSLSSAQQQKNWQELKDIKERGEILTIKIIGANSGGLVSKINDIKAFLPVSQLSNEHYPRVENAEKNKILEELRKFVGKEMQVKIIDLNPRANKLIISEKDVVEKDIKEFINRYKVGEIIEGVVSGMADFGVFVRFVDNPIIEGLIPISELEHRLVDSPKEVVKINEAIKAKIIEIKDDKISLSLKALKPDPWENIEDKLQEGQEVVGMVYKFNPFGAYINLEHGLQGIVHVSDFNSPEEMNKKLEIGKSYQFIVHALKPTERRIFLKLKQ
jgi:small subunit ribosomal protein S1